MKYAVYIPSYKTLKYPYSKTGIKKQLDIMERLTGVRDITVIEYNEIKRYKRINNKLKEL